eukprot:5289370-Pleurochrysis_carterae.AAC.1
MQIEIGVKNELRTAKRSHRRASNDLSRQSNGGTTHLARIEVRGMCDKRGIGALGESERAVSEDPVCVQ